MTEVSDVFFYADHLCLCSRYKEAEEDCTKAIHLDSTYSKAFARRGTARVALGKVEEAREGVSSENYNCILCLGFNEPETHESGGTVVVYSVFYK